MFEYGRGQWPLLTCTDLGLYIHCSETHKTVFACRASKKMSNFGPRPQRWGRTGNQQNVYLLPSRINEPFLQDLAEKFRIPLRTLVGNKFEFKQYGNFGSWWLTLLGVFWTDPGTTSQDRKQNVPLPILQTATKTDCEEHKLVNEWVAFENICASL